MADQIQVSIESLSKLVVDVLTKVGVSKEDSDIILDTILFANRRGVATHGVGRLPLYVHKIAAGHYNPKNEIEVLADNAAYALLDAKNGFGQVVAFKATKMAIEKAKKYGVAVIGVRNSNNFGTAGYFGDMAAREGCAAMVYANAAPAIAPTGGNKTIFGTNPLCYAYPGDETHDPILLDMATTIAARGKIRLAAKNGEKIPQDWAIGPDGQPTDDPNVALKGSLLPIGGYKGYGLSMFVDIFAGMLTGSHYAGEVKNLSKMDEDSGNGHLFVVIDINKFMTAEEKRERIAHFYKAVKACGEEGRIFMPGEIEYNKLRKSGTTIQISNKQFEEINAVAEEVGISSRLKKMNNNKEIAIVLGGTVPHCELIRQLQSMGYYVLLIDYLPNPPAKQVADEHIQESTLDKEAVLRVAKDRKASFVICGCVDQANITACYVMEQLNHRPPYSYETALRITNKGEMKKTMLENNIPTSKYYYFDNNDDLKGIDLRFPVMVKPADSNSANGVRKAYDMHELSIYLEDAMQISRNHRAIVEEFVEGVEISAYCYVKNHHAKLLMAAERLSVMDGEDEVIKCYSSIAPARIGKKAEKLAEIIATQIAEAYQLDNTPLFFQGILSDGRISVIEFAPRVGGGSCFKTIKENTGFDVIEATIDSWLGIPVSFDSWHYPNEVIVVNTVYGKDGIFDRISGYQKFLEDGTIEALYPIRSSGEKIDNSRASSSRICFIVVKADTLLGIVDKIRKIYDEIDVISPEGKSLLRRDISIYSLKERVLN